MSTVERAGAVAKFWLDPVSLASSSRFAGHELRWLEREVNEHRAEFLEAWSDFFSSRTSVDPRAVGVSVDADTLTVDLADGRRVIVPLVWFPRLLHAEPAQRLNWRLVGDGHGIHWPELDEDLSVEGLLRGAAAPGASRRAV